jgi:hypothetical protein
MEKNDLIKLLNEIFNQFGFKRKGSNWVHNGNELTKIVNLQKSNYGNAFYINYGFIINGLELTTRTHVEDRLASSDKDEQKRITDMLDLETEIQEKNRSEALKALIYDKIAGKIQSINTKADLLNELKKRHHLNNIPLVVKKHFNLD